MGNDLPMNRRIAHRTTALTQRIPRTLIRRGMIRAALRARPGPPLHPGPAPHRGAPPAGQMPLPIASPVRSIPFGRPVNGDFPICLVYRPPNETNPIGDDAGKNTSRIQTITW
jgi:hypothetical protein